MYAVRLLRRRNERDEEYGRVLLEGNDVVFHGLSSVFQAYLRRGIADAQQRVHVPDDGISFLKNLKHCHIGLALRATDVEEVMDPLCAS